METFCSDHNVVHGASLDDANGHQGMHVVVALGTCPLSSWALPGFRFSLQGSNPAQLSALKAILESSIGDQPLPTMMPSPRQVMSTQPVKHLAPGKALGLTGGSALAQTVRSSLLRGLVAAARLRLFVRYSACPSFQDALHLHCIELQRWHQRHPVDVGPATTWVPGNVFNHSRGPFWK